MSAARRVGQQRRTHDPAALKVAQAVKQAAGPEHVILFGSRARGDHRADSDIDLLIIGKLQVDEGYKERLDNIANRAAETLHPQTPVTDLAFMTGEQFLRERSKVNSLAHSAAKYGVHTMPTDPEDPGYEYQADSQEAELNWKDINDRAKDSLDSLSALVGLINTNAAESWVGYAAQQALEHGYKALISALGAEYPKSGREGHDLSRLVQILQVRLQTEEILGGNLVYLTAFAGAGRYEGERPDIEDRHALVEEVSAVVSNLMDEIENRTGTRLDRP